MLCWVSTERISTSEPHVSYQTAPLDRLATNYARPDDLGALLLHREPRFESGRQFGAFCKLVQDHDATRPGAVSPMSVVMDILALGCIVDASPPAYTPSPIPYHTGWIQQVHREAERKAGRQAIRAWVVSDVAGMSGRVAAAALEVGRTKALELIDTGRAAIEDALAGAGYLHQ